MRIGIGLGLAVRRSIAAAGGGLGPELAVNGGFDDGSNWILPTGDFVISGGKLSRITPGASGYVSQLTIALVAGTTYRVQYAVSNVSGADNRAGGRIVGASTVTGTLMTGNGNYSADIVAPLTPASFGIVFVGGFLGDVDNFSIRQVL